MSLIGELICLLQVYYPVRLTVICKGMWGLNCYRENFRKCESCMSSEAFKLRSDTTSGKYKVAIPAQCPSWES